MRGIGVLTGRKILVIEDDDDTRETIQRLLQALGAEVGVAADGLEGLVQLERRRPDAVLCDLGMPIMDGIEFARRMRQNPRYRRIILLAVTGRERQSDFVDTWGAGFDGHLVKPLTAEALDALVRRLSVQSAADAGA
jgi:CheY-like chemotaxis protein